MRKIICLLLVLALCVGLCGTVFAAVNSPGQGGEAPTVPGGDVGGGSGGGKFGIYYDVERQSAQIQPGDI